MLPPPPPHAEKESDAMTINPAMHPFVPPILNIRF
jgi:hypothetical protein